MRGSPGLRMINWIESDIKRYLVGFGLEDEEVVSIEVDFEDRDFTLVIADEMTGETFNGYLTFEELEELYQVVMRSRKRSEIND